MKDLDESWVRWALAEVSRAEHTKTCDAVNAVLNQVPRNLGLP